MVRAHAHTHRPPSLYVRGGAARLRACAVWGICTRGAVWSLDGLEATRGPKTHNKPTLYCSRTAPRIVLPPSGLVSKIRSGRSNPQASASIYVDVEHATIRRKKS